VEFSIPCPDSWWKWNPLVYTLPPINWFCFEAGFRVIKGIIEIAIITT
jgi:hypothetical protein